jgi:hypothetical protein
VSLASKLYFAGLSLLFVIGVGLVAFAQWEAYNTAQSTNDLVLDQIQHTIPALTRDTAKVVAKALDEWRNRVYHEGFRAVLLRDLGIAFIVAVLLTIVIERYARNRLADELRSGIVEATFQRLIHPKVFDQVRHHVMNADLLKENWQIEMVVSEDPDISRVYPDFYVSKTLLRYTLRNISGKEVTHPFEVELDRDVTGPDGITSLPKFESITVGTEKYDGNELQKRLTAEGSLFACKCSIGETPVQIVAMLREIIRVPDTITWSTMQCADGAKFSIDVSAVKGRGIAFEVTANHPQREALKTLVKGRSWEFPVAMLPWQGFEIRSWKLPVGQIPAVTGEMPVAPKPQDDGPAPAAGG